MKAAEVASQMVIHLAVGGDEVGRWGRGSPEVVPFQVEHQVENEGPWSAPVASP